MSNVDDLLHLDVGYVFAGLILIGVVLKFIWELLDFLLTKTGVEFKWKREQKDDHQLLLSLSERVANLEKRLDKDTELCALLDKKIATEMADISNSISKLTTTINEMSERDKHVSDALIEIMADRINLRCHKYLQDGSIPEDEVSEFNLMLEKYKAIGGNHGIENKVHYCLEELPIVPSTFEMRKES